jgi:DNA-binding NtrC family response regulator
VLVVDDEPAIRGVLCEFLSECGLHPLAAEDAAQAIAIIEQGAGVDLVFSEQAGAAGDPGHRRSGQGQCRGRVDGD